MVYFITWKMHVFSHELAIKSEKTAKPIEWGRSEKLIPGNILQNPSHVESLGNWYSYFSYSMRAFFPLDSHTMVYFTICEIYGFPHQFPVAWENAVTSIELGEPRKLVPIFSLTYGYISSIRFHFMVNLLPHGKCMVFPIKINSVTSLVVFSQYYFFYLFQNLLIP